MYRIERQIAGIWGAVAENPGDYDPVQARHHAEEGTEKTGDPHRVLSEKSAVIYCSGCATATNPKGVV